MTMRRMTCIALSILVLLIYASVGGTENCYRECCYMKNTPYGERDNQVYYLQTNCRDSSIRD